jgi:GntR family transcriptional regulator
MEMATRSDPRQYMRLAAFLREQITSGKLPPGSRVPSITVLCRERGTSRRTAGRAMQLLEEEALVHRVPGLGYFVRDDADTAAAR